MATWPSSAPMPTGNFRPTGEVQASVSLAAGLLPMETFSAYQAQIAHAAPMPNAKIIVPSYCQIAAAKIATDAIARILLNGGLTHLQGLFPNTRL